MALPRASWLVMLTLGVLLLVGRAAAEGIQRSTDERGTIRINNTGPASNEKAAELSAPPEAVAPEQGPRAVRRRSLSRQKELRQKAISDKAYFFHQAPAPESAPDQPEQPPGVHQTPATSPPAQVE